MNLRSHTLKVRMPGLLILLSDVRTAIKRGLSMEETIETAARTEQENGYCSMSSTGATSPTFIRNWNGNSRRTEA